MDRIANEQHWDRIHSKENLPWNEKSWCDVSGKTIRHFLEISKANRVLDFGCGFGRYQDIYASVCKSVTLVDISGKAIEESKRWGCVIRSDHSIKYLKSDLDGLVNEGLEFDLIVCWGVLHNYPENQWGDFIKSFSKLLRPGGYLLVGGWGREAARFESQDPVSDVTGLPTYSISDLYLDDALCSSFQILEQDVLDAPPTKCTDVAGHDIEFNAYQYLFCKKDSDETTKRHVELVKFLDTMREKIYLFQTIKYSFVAGGRDAVLDRTNSITGYWDEDLAVDILKGVIIATKESGSLTANLYDKVGDLANIFALKVFLDNGVIKDSDNEGDLKKLKDLGKVFTLEEEVSNSSVYNIASSSLKYVSIYDFLNKVEIDKISFGEAPFDLEKVMGQILHSTNKELHFYCFRNPVYKIGKGQFSDGVLFLYAAKALSAYEVGRLNRIFTRWSTALTFRSLMTLVKTEATKSAIGSIMSRNGSHNIGSHVLAALSHNVGTMPDDRVLYQYIQNRMDYIATATTDFPKWTYTTKFVGGMVREFLSQRHLLDYISRSEGLHAFRFQDHNNCGIDWAKQENTIQLHVCRVERGLPQDRVVSFLEYPESISSKVSRRELIAKAQNNLQYDLDVAIPGGVIGQHAFFTIVENIIRNAAKHGWSALPQDQRCESKDHLEVCVSFELESDCRNVLVRVSDNISDVFGFPKSASKARNSAYKTCKDWIEENRAYLERPMPFEDFKLMRDFLMGRDRASFENLPAPYASLYKRLLGNSDASARPLWREIEDLLIGTRNPKDSNALGFRLWLPLHHAQQMILAETFIGEDGALRREHWGLAEMKISAGFLQMRSVEDIGGLNDNVNDCRWDNEDALLIPCCDRNAHLEYQFRIRCPREIAFVLRQSAINRRTISQEVFGALQKRGVYVVVVQDGVEDGVNADQSYSLAFKSGEKVSLNWDYHYIVLPSFPDLTDPQLPFRVLIGIESQSEVVNNMSPLFPKYQEFADRLLDLDANNEDAIDSCAEGIKCSVYSIWASYWTKKRRQDIKGEVALRLNVFQDPLLGNDSSKNGAERCLISDGDVWETALNELFRTYARRMIQKELGQSPQFHVKTYLAVLAVVEKRSCNHFDDSMPRVAMMEVLTGWVDSILCDEATAKVWFEGHVNELCEFWKSCKATFTVDFKLPTLQYQLVKFHGEIKKWINDCKSNGACQTDAPRTLVNGQPRTYSGLSAAMTCLEDVFEYVNVMLRKYEERIVTLPESFKLDEKQSNGSAAETHSKKIGLKLCLGAESLGSFVTLNYIRHYRPYENDMIGKAYAEPLSGTQSYLNTLGQLVTSNNDECQSENQSLLVMLHENALSRILIVDERTADFVEKHKGVSEVFSRMGMWVYDHTTWSSPYDENSGIWREGFRLPMTRTILTESEVGLEQMLNGSLDWHGFRFDVLIIHQGLIDKWCQSQAHRRESVARLLANLRKYVPYVLITTGRGTPANTPNTGRILPFSVIEKTLFRQAPEKLILMDTVMNVQPIGVRK